jgi:hypothetical protein
MVGLIQLFLFIKVLEEDFDAVMRDVLIKYRAAQKGQNNISLDHWDGKRKGREHPIPQSLQPLTTQDMNS